MKEKDCIFFDDFNKEIYHSIVEKAVKYAIISLPFTTDRMRIEALRQRVFNIAKGKIAEGLFELFCEKNNVPVDFNACATPFWQSDRRDFIFNKYEWDIKNNFIYTEDIEFNQFTLLPALIPNKNKRDQWSTKNTTKIKGTKGVKYLFTFIRGATIKGKYFFKLNFSSRQKIILQKFVKKYGNTSQNNAPFTKDAFWNYFLKDNTELFTLHNTPKLVITGYADANHWNIFKNTSPFSTTTYYQDYNTPYWYKKVKVKNTKKLKWGKASLWTLITNKTVPVALLPAFKTYMQQD